MTILLTIAIAFAVIHTANCNPTIGKKYGKMFFFTFILHLIFFATFYESAISGTRSGVSQLWRLWMKIAMKIICFSCEQIWWAALIFLVCAFAIVHNARKCMDHTLRDKCAPTPVWNSKEKSFLTVRILDRLLRFWINSNNFLTLRGWIWKY